MENNNNFNFISDTEFTQWVNLYTYDMFARAFHKTQDKQTAEDLVQETFLSAYKSLSQFNNESAPKTWLIAILNRKIIDYYRTQAKSIVNNNQTNSFSLHDIEQQFFEDNGSLKSFKTADWESNQTNDLDNPEFIKAFKKCMSKLPVQWQSSIKSKFILEKKSKDVCQELGITPSNYWQILHRAKLLLKQCLEHQWYKV